MIINLLTIAYRVKQPRVNFLPSSIYSNSRQKNFSKVGIQMLQQLNFTLFNNKQIINKNSKKFK